VAALQASIVPMRTVVRVRKRKVFITLPSGKFKH
jgi:hypothetical protein